MKDETSLKNTISHQKLISALQNVQANLVNLKRDRDEIQLKLSDKERELTETRKEVASVIEKKKRLEQASITSSSDVYIRKNSVYFILKIYALSTVAQCYHEATI